MIKFHDLLTMADFFNRRLKPRLKEKFMSSIAVGSIPNTTRPGKLRAKIDQNSFLQLVTLSSTRSKFDETPTSDSDGSLSSAKGRFQLFSS